MNASIMNCCNNVDLQAPISHGLGKPLYEPAVRHKKAQYVGSGSWLCENALAEAARELGE